MTTKADEALAKFVPAKGEKYDPGQVVIFFDNRMSKSKDDKFSYLQSYWMETKCMFGWPSWEAPVLDAGKLRVVWYTHAGAEGSRDYPLYQAEAVKEMFDSLSEEGFRPMVLGWSGENPFPMIGGSEPPLEPKKKEPKRATTWSSSVSGHGKAGSTPHDRVMDIIEDDEKKEREQRKEEVTRWEKDGKGSESIA